MMYGNNFNTIEEICFEIWEKGYNNSGFSYCKACKKIHYKELYICEKCAAPTTYFDKDFIVEVLFYFLNDYRDVINKLTKDLVNKDKAIESYRQKK